MLLLDLKLKGMFENEDIEKPQKMPPIIIETRKMNIIKTKSTEFEEIDKLVEHREESHFANPINLGENKETDIEDNPLPPLSPLSPDNEVIPNPHEVILPPPLSPLNTDHEDIPAPTKLKKRRGPRKSQTRSKMRRARLFGSESN